MIIVCLGDAGMVWRILGQRWPAPEQRLEMLEEAIEVMRLRHP